MRVPQSFIRRATSLPLVAAFTLLASSTTGCASGNDSYSAAPPNDYRSARPSAQYNFEGDDEVGDDDAMFEDSLDLSSGRAEAPSRKYKRRSGRSSIRSSANAVQEAEEQSADDADQAGQEAAGQDQTEEDSEPTPSVDRLVVYTGDMEIEVYNIETAIQNIGARVESVGGYVHRREQQSVVLKIPASHFKEIMSQGEALGHVIARSLRAQDVTAAYVDLESRIRVLQETQNQLLKLLNEAKTVEEALKVRIALDNVTMELEVALGRMRQLKHQISMSTLVINFSKRGPTDPPPGADDPFPWVDSLGVEATEWN